MQSLMAVGVAADFQIKQKSARRNGRLQSTDLSFKVNSSFLAEIKSVHLTEIVSMLKQLSTSSFCFIK